MLKSTKLLKHEIKCQQLARRYTYLHLLSVRQYIQQKIPQLSECIPLLFSQIDLKKGSDVQLRVISISSGFNRRMGNLFQANVTWITQKSSWLITLFLLIVNLSPSGLPWYEFDLLEVPTNSFNQFLSPLMLLRLSIICFQKKNL